jgi:hypothetical protein
MARWTQMTATTEGGSSHLAELPLDAGLQIHGLVRRPSVLGNERIDPACRDSHLLGFVAGPSLDDGPRATIGVWNQEGRATTR